MSQEKVEFDDNYLLRVREFLSSGGDGKAAFISRSSGSGENSHAFLRKSEGVITFKGETYTKEEAFAGIDDVQGVLLGWEQRMRSRWAGSGMKVFPMEETPRNRNGKLPYYIKLTTK